MGRRYGKVVKAPRSSARVTSGCDKTAFADGRTGRNTGEDRQTTRRRRRRVMSNEQKLSEYLNKVVPSFFACQLPQKNFLFQFDAPTLRILFRLKRHLDFLPMTDNTLPAPNSPKLFIRKSACPGTIQHRLSTLSLRSQPRSVAAMMVKLSSFEVFRYHARVSVSAAIKEQVRSAYLPRKVLVFRATSSQRRRSIARLAAQLPQHDRR